MIFVLSGMVGYLYWQQTRLLQQIQSLALVVATRLQQDAEPESSEESEDESDAPTDTLDSSEEDDRVEVVEGPPEVQTVTVPNMNTVSAENTEPEVVAQSEPDVDDLQTKTVVQLRELLTKKGIPFGKRDSKTLLLQLLKATA
jgi:cytoskeletal protein RodZ